MYMYIYICMMIFIRLYVCVCVPSWCVCREMHVLFRDDDGWS